MFQGLPALVLGSYVSGHTTPELGNAFEIKCAPTIFGNKVSVFNYLIIYARTRTFPLQSQTNPFLRPHPLSSPHHPTAQWLSNSIGYTLAEIFVKQEIIRPQLAVIEALQKS